MPEGHTLHRLAIEHAELLGGRTITASSPQGRFAAGAARIDGATLTGTDAHGKHLLHVYESPGGEPLRLHIHLGLYGTFARGTPPAPEPRGALRLRLATDDVWLDLRGPTACGLLTEEEAAALHARLGADPLRSDADPDAAGARVRRSRAPIAQLLMDQAIIAGVGNVYRAEVLFRHGVDPYLPGRAVDEALWKTLWSDLVDLMRAGVRTGRIDTVRPEHEPEAMGRPPRVDDHGGEVYVYRRADQGCHVCGSPVRTALLQARNLYWCPTCQRP